MVISKLLLDINDITWGKKKKDGFLHFWTGWGDRGNHGQTGLVLFTQHGGGEEQANRDFFLPAATLLSQMTSTLALFSLEAGERRCCLVFFLSWVCFQVNRSSVRIMSWECYGEDKLGSQYMCVCRCWIRMSVRIMCVYNAHLLYVYIHTYMDIYIFMYKCGHRHIYIHTHNRFYNVWLQREVKGNLS